MHCKICNAELSDFESTRKDAASFQYLDLCNECVSLQRIRTYDRYDLADDNDLDSLDCHLDIDDDDD